MKTSFKSLENCKSYEHLHDGVSAFTEHVENHFGKFFFFFFFFFGGLVECFVCNLKAVMVMNIALIHYRVFLVKMIVDYSN